MSTHSAPPRGLPALHDLLALMPFASLVGVELRKAEPGQVIGGVEYTPRLCTAGAVLHGGVLMTLADTVGAICAYLNLPPGGRTATTTSATNFLRPIGAGFVTATAAPVHLGRSVIVVRVDLTDAHGKLAATTTQTQAVLLGGPQQPPQAQPQPQIQPQPQLQPQVSKT